MIEVYDVFEKQHVMLSTSKIIIVYHDRNIEHAIIKVDGLDYPIKTRESYDEIKSKLQTGVFLWQKTAL